MLNLQNGIFYIKTRKPLLGYNFSRQRVNQKMKTKKKTHIFYVCLADLYDEKQTGKEIENIFYYSCII